MIRPLALLLLLAGCASPNLFLESPAGDGSAVLLDSRTAATARHVAKHAPVWLVQGEDGYRGTATVTRTGDPDYAILSLDPPARGASRLRCDPPSRGEAVYTVSNPGSARWLLSRGYVAGRWEGYTVINLPIAPGSSGAGVFDSRGALIGVITGTLPWPVTPTGTTFSPFALASPLPCGTTRAASTTAPR